MSEPVSADEALSVVLMTVPDGETGQRIARALVDERLIACANLLPRMVSVYRWEGEVRVDSEHLVVMKTRARLLERLFARAAELHPYSVPELIAVPVTAGSPPYRAWVLGETADVVNDGGGVPLSDPSV